MTIYNIADILTGLIEAIMMMLLCEAFFYKRENLPSWAYGVGVIALTATINISNTFFNFGMLNVVVMILSFFAMSFLYIGKLPTRAIISVLNYLLIIIVEIMIMFSITIVYDISVSDAVNVPAYRLLGTIVSKMLSLLIANIIRIKLKQKSLYMSTSYWLLFFLMFLSSTATVFLIFKLSYDIDGAYMYNLSVLCSFGVLFSTLFALFLYERLAKQAQTIRNQEQYEQHLKSQLKHLDDILVAQEQLKKFKHDYNNFQIGLEAYLNSNDIAGANKYLKDLREKTNTSDNIIETGNTALDAILSTKIAIAEGRKIAVSTKIQIPENISIEPIDICIIFGNALDNAIEACDRTKVSDKQISITIICKDEAVLCKIVNTTPKLKHLVPDTSKTDKQNHGFGLENIKTALLKYNAAPAIERTDTEFILKFVIFTK